MVIGFYDLKPNQDGTHSLALQVASELGQQIVSSIYKPGELIEDEGALAKRFDVSRSVVRDAVKILVGKGLIEVRRGIGTRVRPRGDWGLLDNDVLAWGEDDASRADRIWQLLEVRLTIEPRAAALAARRGERHAIEDIGAALSNMVTQAENIEQFVAADAQFHRAILHATGNEFFAAFEGVIFSALLASMRCSSTDMHQRASALPYHVAVYEAINAGDEAEAERTMINLLSDADDKLHDSLQINTSPVRRAGGEDVPISA